MAITPYYASLIAQADFTDPIFQMAVPQGKELFDSIHLQQDPLHEDNDMPVPGLIHRYPDRALIITTSSCAMYCRHCTRKRKAGEKRPHLSEIHLAKIKDYLENHSEIRDVIISGGDPFTLETGILEHILATIRSIPSVEILRIGTRTLVTLPMRITSRLAHMLHRYHPLWINTHFNHPQEITKESSIACSRLADAGIPLGNQSVLLRGINDNPQVMEKLCRSLIRLRVRPYYLFQCDLVNGVEHFRTSLSKGIEIMEYLRGRLSGIAIPTFVVDAPQGGGKIPVLPNYIVSTSPTHTVLRNYEGVFIAYPEPMSTSVTDKVLIHENRDQGLGGIWGLASGRTRILAPADTNHVRRFSRKRTEIAAPSTRLS